MNLAPLARLAAILVLIGLPAAARGQTPPLADPDSVLVEELVVTARDPGPPWWRVSDADSTVYVLGVPAAAPKGLAWDRAALERRLTGASRVILPPDQVSVGVLGAPGAAFNLMRLRSGQPYETRLPAGLRARFAAARQALGDPASAYKTGNGLAAGLLLMTRYRDHARLTAADPAKTIGRLARARGVRVEQPRYSLGALAGGVIRTPAAAQQACLETVLDEIEAGPGQTIRAGEAWAAGDVRGALSGQRGYERCLGAAAGAQVLDQKVKADQAAAIERALAQPGHAVAVVHLPTLLSQGGVLDRLRAAGYAVRTPGDAEGS